MPFLKLDDVSALLNLYNKYQLNTLKQNHISGLTYSLFELNGEANKSLSNEIYKLLKATIETVYENYWVGAFSFITKQKVNEELMLHRDWCYTDENKSYSATAWVALNNVDENNGALFYVPQSHKTKNQLRSGTYLSERISFEKMKDNIQWERLNSGDAVFFHPNLLHGSFPNKSDESRIILTFILTPKFTPLIHYKRINSFLAKKYAITENDFFYNLQKISDGKENDILQPIGYTVYLEKLYKK
jgi:ectoine hydroxylase-related dioxygenase (phytanoyl-CoA dioxygenase family)